MFNRRQFIVGGLLASCARTANATTIILPSRIRQYGADLNVSASSGNDATGDLTHPFKTIQAAVDWGYANLDTSGGKLEIKIADGFYDVGDGVNINYPLMGSSILRLVGNTSSPKVELQCSAGTLCLAMRDKSTVIFMGLKFSTRGKGSIAVACTQNSIADMVGKCWFGDFTGGFHFLLQDAGINQTGDYEITGGAAYHIWCSELARMAWGNGTITIPNSIAFSAFLRAQKTTIFTIAGGVVPAFSYGKGATVTGQKFSCADYGTNVQLLTTALPGSIAGTTDGKAICDQ